MQRLCSVYLYYYLYYYYSLPDANLFTSVIHALGSSLLRKFLYGLNSELAVEFLLSRYLYRTEPTPLFKITFTKLICRNTGASILPKFLVLSINIHLKRIQIQAIWWIQIQTQNLYDQNSKYLTVPKKLSVKFFFNLINFTSYFHRVQRKPWNVPVNIPACNWRHCSTFLRPWRAPSEKCFKNVKIKKDNSSKLPELYIHLKQS